MPSAVSRLRSQVAQKGIVVEAIMPKIVPSGNEKRCAGAEESSRTGSIGPWLVPYADESQLADIRLETRVNGEVRQLGNTADMVFDVYELVSFVSRSMTLWPGDVLTTGTPPGVGPVHAGEVVEVTIEGIGTLRNPVIREDERS